MPDVEPGYGDVYRAKPVECRAIKLTKVNINKVARWVDAEVVEENGPYLRLVVNDHWLEAFPGIHYVCRSYEGDVWVEDGETFKAQYDLVEVSVV